MKRTILLTDVERRLDRELRNKLLMQQYQVLWAHNVQDALNQLDLSSIDLVLLDMDVPFGRGLKPLLRMSQLNPTLRVIALTERSDMPETGLGVRLSGVAEKPVDVRNLLSVIEAMLTQGPGLTGFCYVPPKTSRHKSFSRLTIPGLCPAPKWRLGLNY
jgi:DNA-binding response OmpR family regulator